MGDRRGHNRLLASLNPEIRDRLGPHLQSAELKHGSVLFEPGQGVTAAHFPVEAAGVIQGRGLIEYHRGRMRIKDRAGLEEASCECYETVRRVYDRVLPWGSS